MKRRVVLLALLGVAVVASAVGVVYAKHQSRGLFVELQSLHRDRDTMEVEWGQLQLEQSTWSTHDRVVSLAHRKLDLSMPAADAIILVTP